MKVRFKVLFLEGAAAFLDTLDAKARDKIIYNIRKAQVTLDKELFKKLTGEIWEFRTFFGNTHYRLFAFWDKSSKTETIVISTHGLIKKTGRTPPIDIARAERLRNIYLKQNDDQEIPK